jgi:hypothetical protein
MSCPECYSDEIYEASSSACEPHGETHSEVFMRCSSCRAMFDESDALSSSDFANLAADNNSYYDEQEAA